MSAPETRWGRAVFATAMFLLGLQSVLTAAWVPGLAPVSDSLARRSAAAALVGALLALGGVGLLVGRYRRTAALVVAGLFAFAILALHLPRLAGQPRNGSVWTATFEAVALCSAAVLLWTGDRVPAARGAHIGFALALLVFGTLHLIYHDFVAMLVPAWIPGGLLWAWATGFAFIAAGLAIGTGIQARLASRLLAVMFGAWVLVVHAPRVAAAFGDPRERTSLLVAFAMAGGALLMAPYGHRELTVIDRTSAAGGIADSRFPERT